MQQVARNVTMAEVGFLNGCRYLLHDRDTQFTSGFERILASAGVESVRLPARSPNLNAICERWIRSVKEECLSKLILFGERSLRHSLEQYVVHHQHERNHQGKDNVVLFPVAEDRIQCFLAGCSFPAFASWPLFRLNQDVQRLLPGSGDDLGIPGRQVSLANLTAQSWCSKRLVFGFDDSAGSLTILRFEAGIAIGQIVETIEDPAAAFKQTVTIFHTAQTTV